MYKDRLKDHRDDKKMKISNGLVERILGVTNGVLRTESIVNLKTGKDYVSGQSEEFRFRAGNDILTTTDFLYRGHKASGDGRKTEVTAIGHGLELRLMYEAVEGHPVLRKRMIIENKDASAVTIKDLEWERLVLEPDKAPERVVWNNYFSTRGKAAKSVMDDCVMGVHSEATSDGFILGSEAFGVLKQMEVYEDGETVAVGLNNCKETIFEKVLYPGEAFETPAAFLCMHACMHAYMTFSPCQMRLKFRTIVST
jgi:hypothetical protein